MKKTATVLFVILGLSIIAAMIGISTSANERANENLSFTVKTDRIVYDMTQQVITIPVKPNKSVNASDVHAVLTYGWDGNGSSEKVIGEVYLKDVQWTAGIEYTIMISAELSIDEIKSKDKVDLIVFYDGQMTITENLKPSSWTVVGPPSSTDSTSSESSTENTSGESSTESTSSESSTENTSSESSTESTSSESSTGSTSSESSTESTSSESSTENTSSESSTGSTSSESSTESTSSESSTENTSSESSTGSTSSESSTDSTSSESSTGKVNNELDLVPIIPTKEQKRNAGSNLKSVLKQPDFVSRGIDHQEKAKETDNRKSDLPETGSRTLNKLITWMGVLLILIVGASYFRSLFHRVK
ncbi:LPXTG-protein cell wall anchor protein [Enterococcus faecium EnGen0012]|uniref:LPXTG-anchored fibrinogen/nidogen-binding adhesin SgrA n=1 Tax=Enterococcus faecium TaxID=1352 RepID=A0A9X3XSQ5_ENTFC|nr:LPXTG-anchored fibrinogen/nidogen-binding adhesin SgrA [Enterococcus faecium]ELA53468.1 LPXTG-protein cell wall anchor protein [Enterococcus faecium EnGen0012]EMF0362048.1 LPXTG-anchored fibrinogen/nidogen-binding adhesin SgrA [Enterococcus faecium]MDC4248246.1 LPXTG-anchored fibrinogen/nidogen-binding adhesin SgrA [Enterococcus faecium]HAZ4705816.1 LPXTG-anchored fibrinogen/nidogen-binding adhesin SgrA [Enterococcus faecium]